MPLKVRTRDPDTVPDSVKAELLRKMIEGRDRKTEFEARELPGWTEATELELEVKLAERYGIALDEDRMENDKAQVMAEIRKMLENLGVESVTHPSFGSVTMTHSTKTSVDNRVLKEELLRRGVPADTVSGAFLAATKSKKTQFAAYRKPKGG